MRLFAKLEAFNPGGSVKDRIGVAMIEAAEAEGQIEPGSTTIVEATSGNTGIALAFVCAAKGYELVLKLPQGMSRERESLLRLYGARVDITESMGGMGEAVAAARAMAERPDVFLPDQFSNPANPEAHRRTTGPEIARALDNQVDVLVAGVGTGGTIRTGAGYGPGRHSNRLRMLLVSPVGEIGGGEQVFLRLAAGLRERGHDPILACMRPGPLADRGAAPAGRRAPVHGASVSPTGPDPPRQGVVDANRPRTSGGYAPRQSLAQVYASAAARSVELASSGICTITPTDSTGSSDGAGCSPSII